MIPQEKAKQLVDLFYQLFPLDKDVITTDGELNWEYNDWNKSKKAALIALEFANEFADDSYRSCYGYKHTLEYLEMVKQEIEQL